MRIRVKPSKAQALNYLYSLAVDIAHGFIDYLRADLADQRDGLRLPRLLSGLRCQASKVLSFRKHDTRADGVWLNLC